MSPPRSFSEFANYTLAGRETVKNKLAVRSHSELEAREVDLARARENEQALRPTTARTFDADHLKGGHGGP
jgi:hypothetical protein